MVMVTGTAFKYGELLDENLQQQNNQSFNSFNKFKCKASSIFDLPYVFYLIYWFFRVFQPWHKSQFCVQNKEH